MEFTRYFTEIVTRNHPEATEENISLVLANPVHTEFQGEDRIAYWGYIPSSDKYMRVIVESDGKIHNAFYDRNFTKKQERE